MQTNCCVECATSGIFQEIRTADAMCQTCRTVAPLVMESSRYESRAAWIARAFATMEAANVPPVEAIEAQAIAAAKPAKVRCPHYAIIKEFAAVARECGLSMADKDRARGAMGVYLGKRISSRSELTGNDWENSITALRAGVLFW